MSGPGIEHNFKNKINCAQTFFEKKMFVFKTEEITMRAEMKWIIQNYSLKWPKKIIQERAPVHSKSTANQNNEESSFISPSFHAEGEEDVRSGESSSLKQHDMMMKGLRLML